MYTSGRGAPGIISAPRVVTVCPGASAASRPAAAAVRRGTRRADAPACPRESPHALGHRGVCHPEPEQETATGGQVERQRPLRHQHRMHVLNRHHATGHLDAIDLVQCHGQHREQIGLVGQLAHPDPAEALVAYQRQKLHRGVDRRPVAEAGELPEHADLHAWTVAPGSTEQKNPCCRRVGGQTATRSYPVYRPLTARRYKAAKEISYASRIAVTPCPPAAQTEIRPRTGCPVSAFFSASCLAICARMRPPVAANG